MDHEQKIQLVAKNTAPIRREGRSVESLVEEGAAYWIQWAMLEVEGKVEEAREYKKKAMAMSEVRLAHQRRQGQSRSLKVVE